MRSEQFTLRLDDQMEIRRNGRRNRGLHGEWVAVIRRGMREEEVETGSKEYLVQKYPAAKVRFYAEPSR